MSATLSSTLDTALTGAAVSRTANPVEYAVPGAGFISAHDIESDIEKIPLKNAGTSFPDRVVSTLHQTQEVQYRENQKAGILAQARALRDAMPSSPTAWARYAQASGQLNDIPEAELAARRTVELTDDLSPDDITVTAARFLAARILALAGDSEYAEDVFSTLPDKGPWVVFHAAFAEQRGDIAAALERLGDDTSFEAHSYRGYLLLQIGRAPEALAQLRSAERLYSGSPDLLINLAYAYSVLGSHHKAIRAAQSAVSLAPASRRASFNLVSHYHSHNRLDEAFKELQRLRRLLGENDPEIAVVTANMFIASGEPKKALSEVHRAQRHSALDSNSSERADLTAFAANIEWRLGRRSRSSLAEAIRDQIRRAGPTLTLCWILADIVSSRADVREVESLHSELESTLSEFELAPLTIRVLLLQGDFSAAASKAVDYASRRPLDADAINTAVFLVGQTEGRYEAAADMAIQALRRIPASRPLTNNAAFFVALAGQPERASRILSALTTDDPLSIATRGVIAFATGNVAEGLAHYVSAGGLAERSQLLAMDFEDFSHLMRLQETLALHELGLASRQEVPRELTDLRVPPHRRFDARYLIMREAARRLHVPWEEPASE